MRHALIIAIALCAIVGFGNNALGHDFYAHEKQDALAPMPGLSCCAGYDCAPVPTESVAEAQGGFVFVLSPGQHPMVKEQTRISAPYARIRPSPDGRWHLCLSATMQVYCVWGPMGGA